MKGKLIGCLAHFSVYKDKLNLCCHHSLPSHRHNNLGLCREISYSVWIYIYTNIYFELIVLYRQFKRRPNFRLTVCYQLLVIFCIIKLREKKKKSKKSIHRSKCSKVLTYQIGYLQFYRATEGLKKCVFFFEFRKKQQI